MLVPAHCPGQRLTSAQEAVHVEVLCGVDPLEVVKWAPAWRAHDQADHRFTRCVVTCEGHV